MLAFSLMKGKGNISYQCLYTLPTLSRAGRYRGHMAAFHAREQLKRSINPKPQALLIKKDVH